MVPKDLPVFSGDSRRGSTGGGGLREKPGGKFFRLVRGKKGRVEAAHGVHGGGNTVYAVLLYIKDGLGDPGGPGFNLINPRRQGFLIAKGTEDVPKTGIAQDHNHHVETGDTHKVGVREVDQEKPGAGYIVRPFSGGHVFGIDLRGKTVEPVHGIKEIFYGTKGAAAVPFKKKAENTYPKGDKVEVNIDPPGDKGDQGVQGMIHRSNGDTAGKKDGLILQKEKIGKNRPDTSYSGSPQDWIEHNFEHRNKRGLFPRGFVFLFRHTSSPCLLFMINLPGIILYKGTY
jgi:hypothetical protein